LTMPSPTIAATPPPPRTPLAFFMLIGFRVRVYAFGFQVRKNLRNAGGAPCCEGRWDSRQRDVCKHASEHTRRPPPAPACVKSTTPDTYMGKARPGARSGAPAGHPTAGDTCTPGPQVHRSLSRTGLAAPGNLAGHSPLQAVTVA